jgi:Putative MetA-pathway of phenol degradation
MMPSVRTVGARLAIAAALLALLGAAADCPAQEIEPRAYSNIPTGLNFVAVGYAYSAGDISADSSVPLEDASLRVHGSFLGYVRSFDFFGRSANVAVAVPYAWLSGSATFRGDTVEREVSGFGDPRLRIAVNLYGAPSMSLEEFKEYHQDLIIGVSVAVSAPLGQYDSDKLVNIGTNRWAVKPEIGLSKAWGPLILEGAFGVVFFTENDNFFHGRTLERSPIYSLQGHLIYNIYRGIWAALDMVGYRGGRATVDGKEGDDIQESVRVGLTLSFPVTNRSSIKLHGSTGAYVRTGANMNTGGIAWQVRW